MDRFIQIPISPTNGKVKVVDGIASVTVTINDVDHVLDVSVTDEMRQNPTALHAYLHDYASRYKFSGERASSFWGRLKEMFS